MRITITNTLGENTTLIRNMLLDLEATGKYNFILIETGSHHVTWEIQEMNKLELLEKQIALLETKVKNLKDCFRVNEKIKS